MANDGYLSINNLVMSFGSVRAVDDISLDVVKGEFMTFLGPSGSGKTTTLRMIAGQISPESGSIALAGNEITGFPPEKRDIGMVFQNYALFPHMTVEDNIAFPLKMRKMKGDQLKAAVADILSRVHLAQFAKRYPRELSGGQQQRVALARALVFKPQLLLMDEPLGALDRRLRQALQVEIVATCKSLGATVVYVTHDQDEALSMSDRIAVFSDGKIVQIDSPGRLYSQPVNEFVAHFVGDTNLLRGELISQGDSVALKYAHGVTTLTGNIGSVGSPAVVVIRPESIALSKLNGAPRPSELNAVAGTIDYRTYFGATVSYKVRLGDDSELLVSRPIDEYGVLKPGDAVLASWAPEVPFAILNG
jgi:putative spermidine/putrescine transport system ATP-binding protein